MADKSPDAFRTISEAAEEIGLPQHVLRFWETRFSQIKPMKRGGGRRYYRPDDIELLKGIKHLLYDQGFTIKGAQKLIKQSGVKSVVAMSEGDMTALELVAGGEEKSPPPSSGAGKPARDTAEDDVVVGASKTKPSGKFFSRSDNNGQGGQGGKAPALSAEHHALLQETLFELLECKRLLDQTR